jgi:hypothetical protein
MGYRTTTVLGGTTASVASHAYWQRTIYSFSVIALTADTVP